MIGHINLNVRLELVSLSALFAKTQALYLRGKWWNKTLHYGTPQVFKLHVGLCKKKRWEKNFWRAMFLLSMVQSKDLDCLVLVEETTPPSLFSPRFSTATFFPFPCVGLVLVEEEEKWGGEWTSTLLVFVQAPRVTNWFTAVDDNIKRRLLEENSSKCMIC